MRKGGGKILGLVLLLAALAVLVQGCETVGAADKAALARPSLQFDDGRRSQGFVNHVLVTQEQADGGVGGGGGGCGCR
jgi:hypothetical protein